MKDDTVYDFSQAKRGAIEKMDSDKTKITICLDNDVINWFRRAVNDRNGGNYQLLINQALRSFIDNENESLEKILRRVIREELAQK